MRLKREVLYSVGITLKLIQLLDKLNLISSLIKRDQVLKRMDARKVLLLLPLDRPKIIPSEIKETHLVLLCLRKYQSKSAMPSLTEITLWEETEALLRHLLQLRNWLRSKCIVEGLLIELNQKRLL
jgi:hypothetical protein